ncbi:MAG TPA: hypothetical protein VEL47_07245 [Myxococcota bacterium]|nr:hypothetical protein [Myxococcota bacterium]
MLGIGFFEILVIAVVSFIAVGPGQLPVVMRKIAGFYRQFTTLRDELKFQVLSADIEKPDLFAGIADEKSEKKSAPEIVAKDQSHG